MSPPPPPTPKTLSYAYSNDQNKLASENNPQPYASNLCRNFEKHNQPIHTWKVGTVEPQRHVQNMDQMWKIVCRSTVWKLSFSTAWEANYMEQHAEKKKKKDILAYFIVSFYFIGIEMICALRKCSVFKALSYLCHTIKKLSGMEWFAYRSMFVSCEGVWHHRYWNS